MKSQKKSFLIILVLLAFTSVYYLVIPIFKNNEKDLGNELAELTLSSNDLLNSYSKNEEKSDSLYAGKIIEINGTIKEITFLNNRNTIILNSNSETFGVICDINPSQKEKIKQLKKNQKIQIKGICKGFLKDVILLNCSIDLLTNE